MHAAVIKIQALQRARAARRRSKEIATGLDCRGRVWPGGADEVKVSALMWRRAEISEPPPTVQDIRAALAKYGNHCGAAMNALRAGKSEGKHMVTVAKPSDIETEEHLEVNMNDDPIVKLRRVYGDLAGEDFDLDEILGPDVDI